MTQSRTRRAPGVHCWIPSTVHVCRIHKRTNPSSTRGRLSGICMRILFCTEVSVAKFGKPPTGLCVDVLPIKLGNELNVPLRRGQPTPKYVTASNVKDLALRRTEPSKTQRSPHPKRAFPRLSASTYCRPHTVRSMATCMTLESARRDTRMPTERNFESQM